MIVSLGTWSLSLVCLEFVVERCQHSRVCNIRTFSGPSFFWLWSEHDIYKLITPVHCLHQSWNRASLSC